MDANLVEPFLQVAVCFRVYRTTTYNIFCIKKTKIKTTLVPVVVGLDVLLFRKRLDWTPHLVWSGMALHDLQRVARSTWCGLELMAEACSQLEWLALVHEKVGKISSLCTGLSSFF